MTVNKRTIALLSSVIIALFAYGAEYLKKDASSMSPVVQSQQLDTSRIWTRGTTGNAAENAAHHFKKHGHEFGFKTEQEYVAAAVKFTTEPLPTGILKNTQRDGDVAFYNPKTAEYAVKSKRGLIRTYFKLNPQIHGYKSNTDYFNAQARNPANDNRPQ